MSNDKAIVTMAIGEKYLNSWKNLCETNWQRYADKHGYDVICIDTILDASNRAKERSPKWQKCLILSQDFSKKYDRIVWVDSDILINWAVAPCIAANVAVDKVGAVKSWAAPTEYLSAEAQKRLFELWGVTDEDNAGRQSYTKYGLPSDFDDIVQTGVMVFSPHHHRHILEKVYYEYEPTNWKGEMFSVSYELLKADCVQWLDWRFNATWGIHKALYYPFLLEQSQPNFLERVRRKVFSLAPKYSVDEWVRICATTAFMNSFFIHFAGSASEMAFVNVDANSWQDLLR